MIQGAPGGNPNTNHQEIKPLVDEVREVMNNSANSSFPKSLEVATAEVLFKRQRELWEEENSKEKNTESFPESGTEEFKTFVNTVLTQKTLSGVLTTLEPYKKIPIKIFDSGEIDEVDGVMIKGLVEKYLAEGVYTKENTENYLFDVNGITLFKEKLSGLLAREIEKKQTKEDVSEQKKSTPAEAVIPPETHLPENLPLETPLVLVKEVVKDTPEIAVEKIDPNLFAVKRGFFATVAGRLVDRAKQAGKAFIALQDKIEAEHDNQIGVPLKKNDSVLSHNGPDTTDYAKPTEGNGVRFSVIPENTPREAVKPHETNFETHNDDLLGDNAPSVTINPEIIKKEEITKPIKSILRRTPPQENGKTSWFRKLFPKKEEEVWDYDFPAKEDKVPVLNDADLERPSTFTDSESFINSLYKEEVEKKSISPEKLQEINRKLEVVENKTKSLRESLMEKLGSSGKELLSLTDRGAKFFGENVDWKTKVFAGAGLVAAGALSAYATPVVLTAIGVTSLALRGLSAASTYLVLKGILDKKYEAWENEGKTTSDIKKVMYGTGAAILAGVTGQAVGWLAEHGLSSLQDMVSHITSSSATISIPDMTPTPTVPQEIIEAPQPSVPSIDIAPIAPEIIHEVTKGQNLWSILRTTLSKENIDGFLTITQGEQEARIQALVGKVAEDPKSFGISSEKIDLIRVGEKLNLTSLFKK